jgi:hypothetical protein
MPFDDSTVHFTALRDDADLLVTWTSSLPAGTNFQVYLEGRLAWFGTRRSATLPYPTDSAGAAATLAVGAVGADEASTDFSADLPAPGYANRARLTWAGGTWESPTLVGFRVYRGAAPGAAVSYAAPIATVAAYPQGRIQDGAGIGGAGEGGAGEAASRYSYDTEALAPGTWHFGIRPFDSAGEEGDADEVTFVATGPPNPPAPDAAGLRLKVQAYDPGTRVATLAWLASPP